MGETFGARNVFEALSLPRLGRGPLWWCSVSPGGDCAQGAVLFPSDSHTWTGLLFWGQGVMEGHGEKQAEAHVTCSGKYFIVARIPSAATWLLFERCDLPKWQMETETLHYIAFLCN